MVESDAQVDMLAGLESAIEAFEQGLHEYQTQFHAWSENRRNLVSREAAIAEEQATTREREFEKRNRQLVRDQEALAQDKAELEQVRAKLDALAAGCERRERTLREHEDSLGQKYILQEKTAVSHQELTRQLDRRQGELQDWFKKSEQELEERKGALTTAEREIAEERKQFDRDHQELVRFREELTRRESELASQTITNKESHRKLTQLNSELDARQQSLLIEGERIAALRDQVDRGAAELSSLQSQSQARQTEIDTRARTLDENEGRLIQQAEALAERERESQRTAAKSSAQHQEAAHDLERRERELADATRALTARAEAIETDRREIETLQQAVQAEVREQEQRKQELAETHRQLAARQATFKKTEDRLRAAEQALQTERDELGTMRKSVETELAAKRQELVRKEAESLALRDQVKHDRKSIEQHAQSLDRRSEELEQRSEALAEREGELNGQQAKLEAALQSLRNDQTAVEKARSVVAEIDDSRGIELNKVRADLTAMRSESESSRSRERKLEESLGKAQTAHASELHAAEEARATAERLAVQLEDEKRAAAEQRTAIERREHEVLALLKEAETKSAGSTAGVVSSPNDSSQVNNSPSASRGRRLTGLPPDGGVLLAQRQASHTAVATFWADFRQPPSHAGTGAALSLVTKSVVADTDTTESQTAASQNAETQECAAEEALDNHVSAMREASAASRSEAEAAQHKEPAGVCSGPKGGTPSNGKKRKAGDAPVKFTRDMARTAAPELLAKPPAAITASIDLDPETANKLRMMRRLNPTRSDQELLAKISQEEMKPGKAKRKKSWFAFK